MIIPLADVFALYREPHRKYHNGRHLYSMLKTASRFGIQLTHAQHLGILFHDAVYDPTSKTNEEDSETLMHKMCTVDCDEDVAKLQMASKIILATKHHVSNDPEIGIVLDLDLAELGSAWRRYSMNGVNIRKEFSQFTDAEWNIGRLHFLETTIAKPYIFNTEIFREKFEKKARENMNKTILEIKNGLC